MTDGSEFDVEFARSHFPAFSEPSLAGWAFFENAGGSFACRQTIDALQRYYRESKVQPYGPYPASQDAGTAMDRAHAQWAEALRVDPSEIHFGPSTSLNAYVLGHAISATLAPGDEVIVTNQDHEANTGAFRRAARAAGAKLIEWIVDPGSGRLDVEKLGAQLSSRTRFVAFPHASNIVGEENDVALLAAMAHELGARVIVDGVSFAPHTLPDLGALNPDVYLFSLYKTYSVHQGLMVVRNGLIDELPNQGHYFNATLPSRRLTPAGPDHAQVAASGGVLEYVAATAAHHGLEATDLGEAASQVGAMWRAHETALLGPLLDKLRSYEDVRILGESDTNTTGHRCPTVAFVPENREPAAVAARLGEMKIMAGAGHFYAKRLVEAMGVDGDGGVVRLSFVHYTTPAEIDQVIDALDRVLR